MKTEIVTVEKFIGENAWYDRECLKIFGVTGDNIQMLLDLRGWGAIQNLPQFQIKGEIAMHHDEEAAGKFQDELGEWIADAINKKLSGVSWKEQQGQPEQPLKWFKASERPTKAGWYYVKKRLYKNADVVVKDIFHFDPLKVLFEIPGYWDEVVEWLSESSSSVSEHKGEVIELLQRIKSEIDIENRPCLEIDINNTIEKLKK